jgi:hypothetical protein
VTHSGRGFGIEKVNHAQVDRILHAGIILQCIRAGRTQGTIMKAIYAKPVLVKRQSLSQVTADVPGSAIIQNGGGGGGA